MPHQSRTRRRTPAARPLAALWLGLAASAVASTLCPSPARGEPIAGFAVGEPGTGGTIGAAVGGPADQVRTIYPDDGVRAVVRAPADFAPGKPTLLVVFALPNGNTIEQSAGCAAAPGLDWHYDIQHVEAQVRLLRRQETGRNVVVAYVEADTLSWPAWRAKRPDAPRRIAGVVDQLVKLLPTATSTAAASPTAPAANKANSVTVALTCHSGGGAFLLSFADAADALPAFVERVVFLDANYSYDDADHHHGDKYLAWLKGDPSRHLVVVAYDDRDITLNGKKVVPDTGGTWRASARMIERFEKDVKLTKTDLAATNKANPATPTVPDSGTDPLPQGSPATPSRAVPATGASPSAVVERSEPTAGDRPASPAGTSVAPVTCVDGMNGQVKFLLHRNPKVAILHTRLVEFNGLIAAMTAGTPNEAKWGGTFFGPRAYADLVSPLPAIPDRSPKALPAVDVAATVKNLPTDKREQAIAAELLKGNFPPAWRHLVPVTLSADVDGVRHECVVRVMPDVLAVGTDADPLRVPLTPTTAMRVATQLGCTLPTRKIVDAVDAAAVVRLEPRPLTGAREAFSTFVQHNAIVEEQRAAAAAGQTAQRQADRVGLLTGAKKDVVISNRLANPDTRPTTNPAGPAGAAGPLPRVAIYGWRKLDGKAIQPLTTVHKETYVDYSHGVRLVSRVVTVDGRDRLIEDVLADPKLHVLLSGEGPVTAPAAFYRKQG